MSASILAVLEENLDPVLPRLRAIFLKPTIIQNRNSRSFRSLRGFLLFQTRITTCTELRFKLLYPSSGINELQLSREERMADITDVNFYVRRSTSRRKGVPTTTLHCSFCVLRVNALFHRIHSFD